MKNFLKRPPTFKIILLIIIVFLFTSTAFLFSESYTGFDWLSWPEELKLCWLDGFIQGTFQGSNIALNLGIITEEEYLKFEPYLNSLCNVDLVQLAKEIDLFYLKTNRYNWPLEVIVYLRNIWKETNVPSWEDFQKTF